jgi:hypothetical protein
MCALLKGRHDAACERWTYPVGAEIRVSVDGEFRRSQAAHDPLTLFDLANTWRAQFAEKEWA